MFRIVLSAFFAISLSASGISAADYIGASKPTYAAILKTIKNFNGCIYHDAVIEGIVALHGNEEQFTVLTRYGRAGSSGLWDFGRVQLYRMDGARWMISCASSKYGSIGTIPRTSYWFVQN